MAFRRLFVLATLLSAVMVSCDGKSPLSPETEERVGEANSPATLSTALSPHELRQVKFTICHVPPGNPDNAHEITVAEAALPAHFPHGDTLGSCVGDPPPPEECSGACSELEEECCNARIDCTWTLDELENMFCESAPQ